MCAGSKHAKFPLALLARKNVLDAMRGSQFAARKLRLGAAAFVLKNSAGNAVRRARLERRSFIICMLPFLGSRRVILRGARLLSAFCKLEAKLVPRGACCALQGGAGIIYFGSVARTLRAPVMKRTHTRAREPQLFTRCSARGSVKLGQPLNHRLH